MSRVARDPLWSGLGGISSHLSFRKFVLTPSPLFGPGVQLPVSACCLQFAFGYRHLHVSFCGQVRFALEEDVERR